MDPLSFEFCLTNYYSSFFSYITIGTIKISNLSIDSFSVLVIILTSDFSVLPLPIFLVMIGSRFASASYPTLLRSFCMATFVVVPEPKNGSSTVSPLMLNILIRRSAISSG